MNQYIVLIAACLCFSSTASGKATAFFISAGPNASKLTNERLVDVNGIVTNAYETAQRTKWEPMWGGGFNHAFDTGNTPFELGLGMAGYVIRLGQIKGTEFPFINDGLYDTLNYSFRAKSSTIMIESHLTYTGSSGWQPVAIVGVGRSWNRLYDYNEVPSDPSLSASPISPGYADHKTRGFTYELGIGVLHSLFDDKKRHIGYKASFGYRYFNLGKAQLGHYPAQTTTDHLKINHLYTQGFIFSLITSFY